MINFIIIKLDNKIDSLPFQQPTFYSHFSQQMIPPSKEPVTHSILRNSQFKRQSSQGDEDQQSNHIGTNMNSRNGQRYRIQYSRLCQPRQMNRPSSQHVQNSQSQYVGQRSSSIIPQRRQSIVVCQSLPKSKPKYSFTFGHAQSLNQSLVNSTPRQSLNRQQHLRVVNSERRPQSRSIRKDIDICLYTIADKLKQQNQSQECQQSKQFVTNKLGSPQQFAYKPSISQLRKNKKIFLDRSIHRIHPQIVDEYIQTVYKDYNIPNPITQNLQSRKESQRHEHQKQQFVQQKLRIQQNKKYQPNEKDFYENIERERLKIQKRQEQMQRNLRDYQQKQKQRQIQLQRQKLQQKQKQQERLQLQRASFQVNQKQVPQLRNRQTQTLAIFQPQYSLHNTKNSRKNNLISQKQEKIKKKQKKRFLNLTLSKEKQDMKVKKFQSPKKNKKQDYEDGNASQKSRSVKKSSSQKKVMEIKKNISNWKDSEHQFAERYSYLESPYEMIRERQKVQAKKDKQLSSEREVNVVVRPFEEMMKMTMPTQQYETSVHGANTALTQYAINSTSSHYKSDSKYIQSFFVSSEGEIAQEFRYCILCQQPVLSANLIKHEQKCIGWIDNTGQLIMFKELYNMKDDKLKNLMKSKINQIQSHVQKLVQKLKSKQQNTAKQSHETLESKILHSVQNFIHSYSHLQQNQMNVNNKELFSSNYKNLQKITRNNESLILLESTKKLHWFVRLFETYQHRNYQSTYQRQQDQQYKYFKSNEHISTQAKHNQSSAFVYEDHEKNVPVSEFVGMKNSICC